MSIGETIGGYLPESIANMLGSSVLIAIGCFGLWQTLEHERSRLKRVKFDRQNFNNVDVNIPPYLKSSGNYNDENYLEKLPVKIANRAGSIGVKQSIPLVFSLTINNIGSGISGLNPALTTGITFILAILSITIGSRLGEKFAKRMTESWAGLLSSSLIIAIGLYEYFT